MFWSTASSSTLLSCQATGKWQFYAFIRVLVAFLLYRMGCITVPILDALADSTARWEHCKLMLNSATCREWHYHARRAVRDKSLCLSVASLK